MRQDFLLHSLSELRELLMGCVSIVARDGLRIVEVGGESGAFTEELARTAEAQGGVAVCIDPEPSEALRERERALPALHLVEEASPGALERLEPFDAYFIDGDHNYYTVSRELEVTHRQTIAAGRDALIVLHDVGWPCARRDFYYAPERIPREHRHPHDWRRGIRPGDPGMRERGYSGGGTMALAEREGGPANGVLTAVEDFLAGQEGLDYMHIPVVFGVGVIFPATAPWAQSLRALLAPYDRNPLLERLEANRVELYVAMLELLVENEKVRHVNQEGLAAVYADLARTAAENARLKLEQATAADGEGNGAGRGPAPSSLGRP